MEGRQLVAERGLVGHAATVLATRAFTALPFDSLGPVKTLLKRYFSESAWDESDDEALAAAVGPGEGWWRDELDDDLVLEFGWVAGRFRLGVAGAGAPERPVAGAEAGVGAEAHGLGADAVAATFDLGVVPEVTPNPRTLAFRTGPILEGDSRSYVTAEDADDPRAARLLRSFPDISSVLVARDFVAVTLRRPDRWEDLLVPVLGLVAEEFAGRQVRPPAKASAQPRAPVAGPTASEAGRSSVGRETRLARVWRELGSLRPADPADLERVLEAARDSDATHRQVAAKLLGEAPPEIARAEWARLVEDGSRAVRRAAVDAMVDAGREELRPLLEVALADDDAWVRWKALRGLVELGAARSHAQISALREDQDFRVRLEARLALPG